MINILLVSDGSESFADLIVGMRRCKEIEIHRAATWQEAHEMASAEAIDLVVVDGAVGGATGIEIAKKLIRANPMTNCAVVSSLSPEEFHHVSEGMGILAQLPVMPGEGQASVLLRQLENVLCLYGR